MVSTRDPLYRLMRFRVGQLVATPGALKATTPAEVFGALIRHVQGDWGDVCKDDWQANDQALTTGARLLSVYYTAHGVKFWVITEAEPRDVSTVLLPEEY